MGPAREEGGTRYQVEGMTCGGCERTLQRALERALPGRGITVSQPKGEAQIDGAHDPAAVRRAVAAAGFRLVEAP